MLDRVPATAESTAHLFLRSIEPTHRSSRVLDQRFWRNGQHKSPSAGWWPSYLQKIRYRAPSHKTLPSDNTFTSSILPSPRLGRRVQTKTRATSRENVPVRNFAAVWPVQQQSTSHRHVYDVFSSNDIPEPILSASNQELNPMRERSNPIRAVPAHVFFPTSASEPIQTQKEATTPTNREAASHDHKKLSTLGIILSTEPDGLRCDQAWNLFVSLNNQESYASRMLQYLSQSSRPKDLFRARETFRILSPVQKTLKSYRMVIDVALRCQNYNDAINLALGSRHFRYELTSELMASLVDRLLWSAAIDLMSRNARMNRDAFVIRRQKRAPLEYKPPPDPDIFSACARIENLPVKILALYDRLDDSQPVLRAHLHLLSELCCTLVRVCLSDPSTMSSISAAHLHTLLNIQGISGDQGFHESALRTFSTGLSRDDLANLALMVYRDCVVSSAQHRTTLHSLLMAVLEIRGLSPFPIHTYDYLIEESRQLLDSTSLTTVEGRILAHVSRAGGQAALESFLAKHVPQGETPSDASFMAPLIDICAGAGDHTNAKRQFERISTSFGLQQTLRSWTALITAYSQSNDRSAVFANLNFMKNDGIEGTQSLYSSLLRAFTVSADTEGAMQLLRTAAEEGVSMTSASSSIILEALLSHDDLPTAFHFAHELQSLHNHKTPSFDIWNRLLAYSCFKRDFDSIARIKSIMSDLKVPIRASNYSAHVAALASSWRTDEAAILLRAMSSTPRKPSLNHYCSLLLGYKSEGKTALAISTLNEMMKQFPGFRACMNSIMPFIDDSDQSFDIKLDHERIETFTTSLGRLHSLGSVDKDDDWPSLSGTVALTFSYFDIAFKRFINTGRADEAQCMLRHFKATFSETRSGPSKTLCMIRLSLAKMDLALARNDTVLVERSFHRLLEQTRLARKSMSHSWEDKDDISSLSIAKEPEFTNNMVLSEPLNRYMEAMARSKQLGSLCAFLQGDFELAGFSFSGRNWNKFVDVLCRSSNPSHHISAFHIAENQLLNRTQSWRLLIQGLLRRQTKQYEFAPVTAKRPRPVLQKHVSYKVVNRSTFIDLHPERAIPTYETMVRLGAVLERAAIKGQKGDDTTLKAITSVAKRTKHFLQNMPYREDNVQNEIVRGYRNMGSNESSPDLEPSTDEIVNAYAVSDTSSILDVLPFGSRRNLERFAQSLNEVRGIVRRPTTGDAVADDETRLSESITGRIKRSLQWLSDEGRMESADEMEKRIAKEKVQKSQILQRLLADLKSRKRVGAIRRRRSFEGSAHPEDSSPNMLNNTLVVTEEGLANPYDFTPFQKHSRLINLAWSGYNHRGSSEYGKTGRLALVYADTRRVRRRLAEQQRLETAQTLEAIGYENNLSSRATMLRTSAGIRQKRLDMARIRRRQYLLYEKDLKSGVRLPPRPKTKRGYRAARRLRGFTDIRPIADLNRHPMRYHIRRGHLLEKRKPRIAQERLQKIYLMRAARYRIYGGTPPFPIGARAHFYRKRRRQPSSKPFPFPASAPLFPRKTDFILLKTKPPPTSLRKKARKKAMLPFIQAEENAIKVLGRERFEYEMQRIREMPAFVPFI